MDRIALVTGAGSGIGRAVAIRLSQAGLRVVLAGRGAGALAATAAACPGPNLAIPADVTDPRAVDRLFGQALDELLAARNEPKNAALIPENDGMVVDNGGSIDLAKTNLYRSEIGQPLVSRQNQASSSPQMFCQNLINIQTPFIAANQSLLAAAPSPVPTVGDTLYTFLANRLAGSFDELNCQNFGLAQPVAVVINGAGAATQVTLNTSPQTASF